MWIKGLLVDLKHERTCFNLLWYSRSGIQVSIATRMSSGSKSNNDEFWGLSIFVGFCVISVQWRTVGCNSGP